MALSSTPSITIPFKKDAKPKNEGLFYYIPCGCGETCPVLKTQFPILLKQQNLPQDTAVEKVKTRGCPSCEIPADLYC